MNIEEILQAIKKSEGDFINSILPKTLQDHGFKTFYIDEKLLILKTERPEYTLLINIRYEMFDDVMFRLWISKPEYYSDILLSKKYETTEPQVYLKCLTALLDERFALIAQEHLKMFVERIKQIKNDMQNIKED